MDILRSPDPASLAIAAAAYITDRIKAAIAAHGNCHLALAGGSTPKTTYVHLRESRAIDWSRLHIWFGDERCLPPGDANRNDTMAKEVLLDHVPLAAQNLHPIPAELGASRAAASYSKQLREIDRMDIVLLGMGEDGHTASLFPDNAALDLDTQAVPVFDAPKPPPERVSLSLATIWEAEERIVLVSGDDKQIALQKILNGELLPAAMIGSAVWFIDDGAYGCR